MRDTGCEIRGAGCRIRDARYEIRDARYGMRDTGCGMQDTGCGYGMRDTGCGMRDTGCEIRGAGCRLIGHWDLDIGHSHPTSAVRGSPDPALTLDRRSPASLDWRLDKGDLRSAVSSRSGDLRRASASRDLVIVPCHLTAARPIRQPAAPPLPIVRLRPLLALRAMPPVVSASLIRRQAIPRPRR